MMLCSIIIRILLDKNYPEKNGIRIFLNGVMGLLGIILNLYVIILLIFRV